MLQYYNKHTYEIKKGAFMLTTLLKNLQEKHETRQTLSQLRQEIKESINKRSVREFLLSNPHIVKDCIQDTDAKTRKNIALLIGDLRLEHFAKLIYSQYEKEEQLFVKSSYLTALQKFDCSEFIPQIKAHLKRLSRLSLTPETKKHIEQEMRALSQLILLEDGINVHTFIGYDHPFRCILPMNPNFKDKTIEQIVDGTCTPLSSAIQVKTKNIKELLSIRTYSELLFTIPGLLTCSKDPIIAGKEIANSQLLKLLKETHVEPGPFYFRIELKSKDALSDRSIFTKKLSFELEHASNRNLINSTSNYEIEIRLIENKEGFFHVLLKFFTLVDKRFTYRKEAVAASIRPVDAALLVDLAKDYMISDAQVLDPFCGVGTLLIERQKVVKANTSYGIDSFPAAIEKAKINTEAAGQIIHYVNKDCFQFTHEYLFDEIFTNMPFITSHKGANEIEEIYKSFFKCARGWLKSKGTIIMYSHDKPLVSLFAKQYNYTICKVYTISERKETYLFILQ